jgi:hypothetical protein
MRKGFLIYEEIITSNKTLIKHIQNNQKSIVKSIPAYGF